MSFLGIGDWQMRNINELVGIINGIDYDGIINEREIEKLEDWVAKNRNLAYEPRQIELINLIELILKDHIITNDEKEILFNYCNGYLIDKSGNLSIYMLQGIIQGIASDGVINSKEVEKLKIWMENNRNSLVLLPKCKMLVNTIDSILEDGIVTDEEQELMQKILSEEIEASHFESKIEFLKKQVKNKKNIGVDLIDLLGDEESIQQIHKMAENQLKKAIISYSGTISCDTEIIFISLVLIAMLNYEEGRYYESVREKYQNLYEKYSAQKIEGVIRSVLNKYRLDNKQKERNINAALYNSIVPAHYLTAFFDFIYDIYERNFEYNLPDDMYEDFKFVYDGLRHTMLSDGDDIHINVTRKTYKLIKTTKQLITREDCIESIIKLSTIIVRLIDKQIWGKDVRVYNPYLKMGFDEWASRNVEISKTKVKTSIKNDFRSRWEPKYIIENNHIYIVPPIHRIKGIYDYKSIKVEVFNGEESIFLEDRPDVREIIGGYQINIDKILLNNPIGNITYRLVAGDEVLYESRDKLYRSILVFNTDGNEIKNNTDYAGTAIICMKKENDKVSTYYNGQHYLLGTYGAHMGDALLINDIVFNFSSLVRPGIFGEEYENAYLYDQNLNKKYQIYKNISFLIFETTETEAKFEIDIDGSIRMLHTFEYTISKREGVNKFVVNLSNMDNGIHTIVIYQLYKGCRTTLSSFTFVIDTELKFNKEELEDEGYIVSVESSLFEEIVEEIHAENYDINWLEFEREEKLYNIILPFNFEFYTYKGENECWKNRTEEMWLGDINSESILKFADLNVESIEVYGSDGTRIEEDIKVYERDFFKEAKIGFLTSYKESNDYFLLLMVKDGKKRYSLICYNKCILDEEIFIDFNVQSKQIEIVPSYRGRGKVYFSVINKLGEIIYKSSLVQNKDSVYLDNLQSFEEYRICFFEKKTGLSLQGDTKLGEFTRVFYALDDLVGKSFRICEAYYDQFVKGEFLRKHHFFNKTYIRIVHKKEQGIFIGELYTKTREKCFELFRINPVNVEICGDIIDGTVELAITKDGDGLLLDFEHHGIMNTLDDPNAVDIFSYIMDLKGNRLIWEK